jgi:hypothetical protein
MDEAQLLELIQTSIIPDAIKLPEHHEADFYSERYDLYGELKCMTDHRPRLLIERKKYNELMTLKGKKRYICSTPKGVWSWDLDKIVIPENWWIYLPIKNHSTYYHREYDGPTTKEVTWLPTGWGKNITKKINFPI